MPSQVCMYVIEAVQSVRHLRLLPNCNVAVQTSTPSHDFQLMNVHCPDSSMLSPHPLYRQALVQSSNDVGGIQLQPENHVTMCMCCRDCSTLVLQRLVHPAQWQALVSVCVDVWRKSQIELFRIDCENPLL